MKIAIIAHLKYAITEPFAGGLEMHTHLLARHLIARGHAVTLFAASNSDAALNLRAACLPTGTPTDAWTRGDVALVEHRAYTDIIRTIGAGDFDVVHNNSLHYLPLTEADQLSAPMVTTLHTPPFPELENGVLNRSCRDIRFVGVSQVLRDMWRGVVELDEVIDNGIDLDRFAALLTPPPRSVAVWYGRLVPEKGVHLAIAAARRARVPLRVIGPKLDEAYWASAVAPALGGDVTYLGHLDHASLAAEIGRASVAVITPRWEEPYGLVVAEALACGTPVAGFARGALPMLIDAGTGRLAAADDVEGLARAITEASVLSRAACRARAEALCDASIMIDRYEALYQRVLEPALRVAA